MKFIVLGAGMQGVACAYDLLRNPATEKVILVDREREIVERAASRLVSDKIQTQAVDCEDSESLADIIAGCAVAVSALPYRFNLGAAQAAVAAGVSFVDMGGNIETVLSELRLHTEAADKNVTVIPDCGLAPGLANILVADAVAELDEVNDVKVRVGGLPAEPRPPWNYFLVFSFEGLFNEYTGTEAVLRDWNRTEVPALTGDEQISFPDPAGVCEAAFTSGGSSTLPWTFAGRIRNLDYKTVRYPGHYDLLRAIEALGLFDTETVEIEGARISPRAMLKKLFCERLARRDEADLVVLRIVSSGVRNRRPGRLVHEMMDILDEETGLTAMMRTTAYPVSIIAQMIADGRIAAKGAMPPEKAVPPAKLIAELERRGIFVRRTWHDEIEDGSGGETK
jgi:lysine 6-dehydrogenase